MHPGNLSLFDTAGVPPSCVRAYTLTGPTKGDMAYDSGMDVPSPRRRLHSMETPLICPVREKPCQREHGRTLLPMPGVRSSGTDVPRANTVPTLPTDRS